METDEAARGIEPALTRFVAEQLLYDRDLAQVEPEEPLLGSLLDSIDILNLVQFLEEQYGLRVEDDELVPENFQTIRAVASLVSRKLAQGEEASPDGPGR